MAKIERIAQLNLNKREWSIIFTLIGLGIATNNADKMQMLVQLATLRQLDIEPEEVRAISDKMQQLGEKAFDARVVEI